MFAASGFLSRIPGRYNKRHIWIQFEDFRLSLGTLRWDNDSLNPVTETFLSATEPIRIYICGVLTFNVVCVLQGFVIREKVISPSEVENPSLIAQVL